VSSFIEGHTGEFRRSDGRYQNCVWVPDMNHYYAWDRAERKLCPVPISGQNSTGVADISLFNRCLGSVGGAPVQSFLANKCPRCDRHSKDRTTFNIVVETEVFPYEYLMKSVVIARHPHPFHCVCPPPPFPMCAQTHTHTQTHATRSSDSCLNIDLWYPFGRRLQAKCPGARLLRLLVKLGRPRDQRRKLEICIWLPCSIDRNFTPCGTKY